MIPVFDGFRMCDIEQPDLRQFVAHLQARGLAAGSVRKYTAPLKAMFAAAVEDGDLAHNPASGVRISDRRTESATEPAKAMTRVELAKVLGHLEPRWRLAFELLAHTGLRVSELLGIDWSDVQFGERPILKVRRQCYRGTVTVNDKGTVFHLDAGGHIQSSFVRASRTALHPSCHRRLKPPGISPTPMG